MALPGNYTVVLSKRIDGVVSQLSAETPFEISPMGRPAIPPQIHADVLAFQQETGKLLRAVTGTQRSVEAAMASINAIKQAIGQWPTATKAMQDRARELELQIIDLQERLNGSRTRTSRSEPDMPGIVNRVNQVVRGHWNGLHGPTQTHREQYRIAFGAFTTLYPVLQQLIEIDLPNLEQQLEDAGVPWTTGRSLPDWPPDR